MIAEIVSVGTELLLGQITDTNAVAAATCLAEVGISCLRRQTVGDNLSRVTDVLREALARSDIVITIGGLGPTEDDLTREGISAALDDPLIEDPVLIEQLKELFKIRGYTWINTQLRQAMRPACARPLPNPNGTAPGLICEKDGKIVIALPGPRHEFVPMLHDHVRPFLASRGGGVKIVSRVVRIAGLGESIVEDRLRELLKNENPTVAPLAKPGDVHIRLTASASSDAEIGKLLDGMEAKVRGILGDAVYGLDDTTLEAAVNELLRERDQTLTCAESCTGGGFAERITSIPGSSDIFFGGFVTYSNGMKVNMIGVTETILKEFGAVSEQCARAMAEGAMRETRANWSVAITGIAGPGGGTAGKPVGLVYIAVADGKDTAVSRHVFPGKRDIVRLRSTQHALTMLRRAILDGGCASS
jgi:nicotinamide-nucleotide amidase